MKIKNLLSSLYFSIALRTLLGTPMLTLILLIKWFAHPNSNLQETHSSVLTLMDITTLTPNSNSIRWLNHLSQPKTLQSTDLCPSRLSQLSSRKGRIFRKPTLLDFQWAIKDPAYYRISHTLVRMWCLRSWSTKSRSVLPRGCKLWPRSQVNAAETKHCPGGFKQKFRLISARLSHSSMRYAVMSSHYLNRSLRARSLWCGMCLATMWSRRCWRRMRPSSWSSCHKWLARRCTSWVWISTGAECCKRPSK